MRANKLELPSAKTHNTVQEHDGSLQRESLKRLLRTACAEFAQPEQQHRIRQYVRELGELMRLEETTADGADGADSARAQATSSATGEDVVSLLCKFEDYLESIMVGALSKRIGG